MLSQSALPNLFIYSTSLKYIKQFFLLTPKLRSSKSVQAPKGALKIAISEIYSRAGVSSPQFLPNIHLKLGFT
mgnify:CR=1 FL=1